jgi:hypothetical protein
VWLSWLLRGPDWRRSHVHRCQSCRRRFADDEPGCIPSGEERFPQLCRCDLGPGLGHTNCRASGPYCPACATRISDEQREINQWEREWLLIDTVRIAQLGACISPIDKMLSMWGRRA